jgi:general secretion pathway protein G
MRPFALRGISLLEFVLAVALIALISGVLLGRVLSLINQSERVAFVHTTRLIESALVLEAAERVARGESASLSSLAGSNPMKLLFEPPGNYLGTLAEIGFEPDTHRSWYFDEQQNYLVYLPGPLSSFAAEDGPSDRVQMQVEFEFRDRDSDGSFDASIDHFDGLRVSSVYPYSWSK